MEKHKGFLLYMTINQITLLIEDNTDIAYRIYYRDEVACDHLQLCNFLREYFDYENDQQLIEFQIYDDYIQVGMAVNIYLDKKMNFDKLQFEHMIPAGE